MLDGPRDPACPESTRACDDAILSERAASADRSAGAGDDVGQRGNTPLLPLVIDGLTFEIQGRRLIDDITLRISSPGLTVLLGPNGAGKSLFLRLIHGLIPAGRGHIAWGGRPLDAATRARQALVFQTPVLLRRSVAANVEFALRLRGRASRCERDALLTMAGLIDSAGQPARALSGGERQRLALVRALALKPEVLLLDEPTASLDPASVLRIETIVADAVKAGTKVILVTHDIVQARRMADDVVFLHRGRVLAQADADAFFTDPKCEAAEAYLAGRIVL